MTFPQKTKLIQESLPSFVDRVAKEDPIRIFASIPKAHTDLSQGYRDITYRDFARAINRTCEFLEKHIGRNESNAESVVCYIGLSDLRCHFFTLAFQKLGHLGLMSAPRNSLPMHQNLFDRTDCHTLIHDKAIDPKQVTGGRNMKVLVSPSLDEILDPETQEPRHYPFKKTWEEVKRKPISVLHTSGSTGMPKPIYLSHGYVATGAEAQHIPEHLGHLTVLGEYTRVPGRRIYVSFPSYHVGGLLLTTMGMGVYGNTVTVFGPAHLPPFGPVVLDVMRYANIDCMFTVPAPLMELSKSKEGLELMGKLQWIIFAGGAVAKAAGDTIARVTRLQTAIGSTECNLAGIQSFHNPEENHMWEYFSFVPDQTGVEFREHSPGIFEQVFVREPLTEELHAVWKTFPQYSEYLTKDLLSRHPDPKYSHLWKFESRTDDLITFANAGKYNPLAYEEYMASNPLVRSALMAGTMRPCASLLLELNEPVSTDDPKQYQALLDKIWPTVEAANLDAPKHAFIRKEMILLATPAKPFERASKGTPVRERTLKLYASEIDALYKANLEKEAPAAAVISAAAANGAVAQEHEIEREKRGTDENSIARTNQLLAETNETLLKLTETMGKFYDIFARIEAANERRAAAQANGAPVRSGSASGASQTSVGFR